jgi:hypothetical protein
MPYEANVELIKEKYMEVARERENKKSFDQLTKNYIVRRTYLNRQ